MAQRWLRVPLPAPAKVLPSWLAVQPPICRTTAPLRALPSQPYLVRVWRQRSGWYRRRVQAGRPLRRPGGRLMPRKLQEPFRSTSSQSPRLLSPTTPTSVPTEFPLNKWTSRSAVFRATSRAPLLFSARVERSQGRRPGSEPRCVDPVRSPSPSRSRESWEARSSESQQTRMWCVVSSVNPMKRVIAGFAVTLAMVTLSTAAAGGAASPHSQEGTATARCEKIATGHGKVTAAEIVGCRTSSVKSGGHCPSPSDVLIVRVNGRDYALRRSHEPFDLGTQPGMGTYSRACGSAGMPATAEPLLTPSSMTTTPPPPMASTTTTRP